MTPVEEMERRAVYVLAKSVCSNRELQVLKWWSEGVGVRKTAELLGIHASTIREHRRRALRKVDDAITAAAA